MKILPNAIAGVVSLLLCISCFADNQAEKLLKARSAEFQQDVIEVASGVYTAVGFGVSPTSMIVGDRGLIIIETLVDSTAAQAVLSEFQKITNKPVSAIILTHVHGDHTGGVGVFAAAGKDVQIWTRDEFNKETRTFADAGLTIQRAPGRFPA